MRRCVTDAAYIFEVRIIALLGSARKVSKHDFLVKAKGRGKVIGTIDNEARSFFESIRVLNP